MVDISQEKLETIFNRSFKDVGDDYLALCPVHEEDTPSFYVSKETGLVNCFGCKVGGRITKFIEEYKSVDEPTALKMLGLTLHDLIDMEFQDIAPTEDRIFSEAYLAPFERKIHKYVIERGFTPETLKAVGTLYDKSTKKQVFPHYRRDGKLVGAIGRSCGGRASKWHFYWGYSKGRHLYRANVGGTKGFTWVVEGVFDALWCYQHGLDSVAILGSKATSFQIDELKTYYDRLVIALDNDEAGLQGSRDLYTKLKNQLTIVSPVWPKWGIDIMDTNPNELPLMNLVEWELVKGTDKTISQVKETPRAA